MKILLDCQISKLIRKKMQQIYKIELSKNWNIKHNEDQQIFNMIKTEYNRIKKALFYLKILKCI